MDIKDWKRRLSKLLEEHSDMNQVTGHVEINLNRGSVTKAYKIETKTQREGSSIKITTKTELK